MSVNIGIFDGPTLANMISQGKVPYQEGYWPVWRGLSFNATTGEAKNTVLYVKEIHEVNDYYYTTVEICPVETGP